MHNKKGYILVVTMLMIGAITLVVTYMFNRGMAYIPYSRIIIAQEKAEFLAWSGIEIARHQLTFQPKKDPNKQTPASQLPNEAFDREFLTTILPIINRQQDFEFGLEKDEMEGALAIRITSEEGKINLNTLYDFKKHAFVTDTSGQGGWQKLLPALFKTLENNSGAKDLLPSLEKFLKKLEYPLDDVTQLLTIKEFEVFKNTVYFGTSDHSSPEQKKLFLSDVFTVYGTQSTLEPWLFSDGLNALLQLPRIAKEDTKKRVTDAKNWVKPFKKRTIWTQDWKNILKPIYGKELQSLPKGIDSLFNTTFAPKLFSVFSSGTVDGVTKKLYVILERVERRQNKEMVYDSLIKKWYWL